MNQPLASGRTLLIGRSLVSGAAVNLPSSGLAGQVTINNKNISGVMSGSISVGGSALSGPYYTNTAASLGGGSVGLASFALHEESCFPPHNGAMSGTMLDIGSPYLECVPVPENEAVLRFYGPVAISGSGTAVKVEFATFAAPNLWTTVTSDFLTTIDSADHRHVVVTRNPSLGAAWPVGRYRMTRLTDRLLCEGVGAGSPPQVQTFTYIVDVIDECEDLLGLFDLNGDGAVSVAGDVPMWLDMPTDFNGDAAADSADLNLLLQAAEMDGD
ncbi:MAG: hypothetical protein IBJ10_09065 [Phycisphaerales bacterium]|nr:hypothetical protein [Phycisphaerales bacterium]